MVSEYIEVTVSVPRERQAEFYIRFGEWLGGTSEDEEPKGWWNGEPWAADDRDAAVNFCRMISPTALRILSLWARRPGEWMSGEATAEATGVNGPKGVAGSLSSVGKAATKLARRLPFEHETGEAGSPGRYRMTPAVAELFRVAATEATG